MFTSLFGKLQIVKKSNFIHVRKGMNFFKRTMLKSIKTLDVTTNYAPQTCENKEGKESEQKCRKPNIRRHKSLEDKKL